MEKQSMKSLILNYGIMLGVISIMISVIGYITSDNYFEQNSIVQIIGTLLLIVFIVIPIRIFKKNNNGFLELGQAIKISLGVSAISAILSAVYIWVFSNYIEPDFLNMLIEYQKAEAIKANPTMSAEQLNQGIEAARNFMMPMTYVMIIAVTLFVGFLTGLITGLVLKKSRPQAY
ncbi:DUF4199 family protein [Flavobacterium sp. NST-5]|uniref:DUF4199 family protein n=1 Tax=Flavobacterium ichthyis TaxID=2698827 RepID=A0ABW9Z894_9FLAO|nr:DUF4199 domain-containing protein [Flavobacterium ichthyis]NBL64899.1 DUF4199 family protein [Flavobacterium ichthyis]